MFFRILYGIIMPVFLLVGLGYLLDKRLRFDMKTLTDLNFYVFVPALVFLKAVEADLSAASMGMIAGFSVVHISVMYLLGRLVCSTHHSLRESQTVLSLGTVFYNAGNYGIPLILLAFGDEHIEVIAVVLIVQNFLSFTAGIGMLEKNKRRAGMIGRLFKIPTIQAILLAAIIRSTGVDINSVAVIAGPVRFLADGLIPVALLTLGVQLSRSRPAEAGMPLIVVTAMRLVVSPLVAAGMVMLFAFEPPVSSILIVAAGLPVAVNVAILAGVYEDNEDLASQAVFWSTALSALTVSMLLMLVSA